MDNRMIAVNKYYKIAVIGTTGVVENIILGDSDFEIRGKTIVRLAEVDEGGIELTPIVAVGGLVPAIGWVYDGSKFTRPDDVSRSKEELYALLADLRYSAETSGIDWEDEPIKTSRDEQKLFSEIRIRAVQFPNEIFTYKTGSGSFKKQAMKKFLPLAEAVYAHVQKCFAAEAKVSGQIDTGEITTFKQLTEEFNTQIN